MDLHRIEALPRLPKRADDSHKGSYGSVLILAGSRGMAGAAALAAAAALRSGAGLARVASPLEVQPTVASFEPSYMTYPVAQDDEGLMTAAGGAAVLARFGSETDVLAVGPGLGRSSDLAALVRSIAASFAKPLVVDADGLNNLGASPVPRAAGAAWIVTPHPGEAARLLDTTTKAIQGDREGAASRLAERLGAIVVLKGYRTVVTDGRRIFVNTTGNPGMATAGVGDVLTGVISALWAQGLEAIDAACMGVYAHGLAGDIAKDQNGEMGMIAGDVVDALADTFSHLSM
jgi:NAD(P)H-hydrate epimerase